MAKIREEPSVLGRKRGKINILKYAQCFLHNKGLPFRRNYFARALSDLG